VQYADTTEEELDLAVIPWQPKDATPASALAAPAAAAAPAEAAAPAAAAPAAAAAAASAAGAADAQQAAEAPAEGAAAAEDEAAADDGQGRAVKKLKITMKSAPGAQPAAAAEATRVDPLSPTEGTGRPRRQAAATPAPGAAAAGSSGGGAAAGSSAKPAKGSSAEKVKSPDPAEKAERLRNAQVGTRIRLMWTDKKFYTGEITVSALCRTGQCIAGQGSAVHVGLELAWGSEASTTCNIWTSYGMDSCQRVAFVTSTALLC
jgi:hypothetical protein